MRLADEWQSSWPLQLVAKIRAASVNFPICSPVSFNRAFIALLMSVITVARFGPVRAHAQDTELSLDEGRRTRILARLEPVETALKNTTVPVSPGDSGCVVLSERLVMVEEDGRRFIVDHGIYRTLTSAGIESNAVDVTIFRRKEQRAYVLVAETIQPDGSRQAVAPNAMLVHTPQRDAEHSLYDDRAELRVIFPNIKVGSVTHIVVATEDTTARFPGEYCDTIRFRAGSWAFGEIRDQLDLPESMAQRLSVHTTGAGVPSPIVRASGDRPGRSTYQWRLTSVPANRPEIGRAPAVQTGPVVHVTTLRDWNQVGLWYAALLNGRDVVGPKLAGQADAWTETASSRAEIIRILHEKVATDVRYVGLEFGACDYQPHDCNEVWANQYGDCKDKANLLVGLLRRRGIDARIALLDTTHSGYIERRAPNNRCFDHAIVAIAEPDGSFSFCDPTISYSIPGVLSPNDSDRDVLVISSSGASWQRTPRNSAGTTDYGFELKMSPTGDLSGWLRITSAGYYAARNRHQFEKLDREELRNALGNVIRGFFAGAEIVDAAEPSRSPDGRYVVSGYFIVSPKAEDGAKRGTLLFPTSGVLFTDVGNTPARDTSFFTYIDKIAVDAAIQLPQGIRPSALPQPFTISDSSFESSARWELKEHTCRARLALETKQAVLAPENFKTFYQATRSIQTWLQQPLILASDSSLTSGTPATVELDLPLMPTGSGQIDLVDRRYPDGGDASLRRRALERTLDYFPKEKTTVFRASARIASLDWDAGKLEDAHARLEQLLARFAGEISAETFAWAEMLDGGVLADLHRSEEAGKRYRHVATNKSISISRRADAACRLADMATASDRPDLVAILSDVAGEPNGAGALLLSRLIHLELLLGRQELARSRVEAAFQGEARAAKLVELLQEVLSWNQDGDDQRIETVAGWVTKIPHAESEELAKLISQCRARAALQSVFQYFSSSLLVAPLSNWYSPEPSDKTRAVSAFTEEMEAADKAKDAKRGLQLALRLLAARGPESDFPRRLWDAAIYAEWAERLKPGELDQAVCTALLDLCDRLPKSNDYYWEGRLLRALRLANAGRHPEERVILEEFSEARVSSPSLRVTALSRLGKSYEATGDLAKAFEYYRAGEPYSNEYIASANGLLRAVLIALELGKDNEALELIGKMDALSEAAKKTITAQDQLKEFIALSHSADARAYWQGTREWWPAWHAFVVRQGVPEELFRNRISEFASTTETASQLAQAQADGNSLEFWRHCTSLAAAARWQPSLAGQLGSVTAPVSRSYPTVVGPFYLAVLPVLELPQPSGVDGLSLREVFKIAAYYDLGRIEDALAAASKAETSVGPADPVRASIHRLHAMAAIKVGKDLPVVAAAIEKDLDDSSMVLQRAQSVSLLAQVYSRLGRANQQLDLLERELASAAIKSDAQGEKLLRDLRAQLQSSAGFTAALARWQKSHLPAWYHYASPSGLDDPRFRDPEKAETETQNLPSIAERTKAAILLAQDERRSLAGRQTSFSRAIRNLLQASVSYSAMDSILRQVVDDPDFGDSVRVDVLSTGLALLSDERQETRYRQWRSHPLAKNVRTDTLRLLDSDLEVDRKSAASVLAFLGSLTNSEVTSYSLLFINDQLARLYSLGAYDAADKFIEQAGTWSIGPDVNGGRESLLLNLKRRTRAARQMRPVHEALRSLVRSEFPNAPATMPGEYTDIRMSTGVRMLTPAATVDASLWIIANGTFDRESLSFWHTFISAVGSQPSRAAFVSRFITTELGAAGNDALTASIIGDLVGKVDLDNPEIRSAFESAVRSYRNSSTHPQCYLIIRMYEGWRDRRLGAPLTPENSLSDLQEPFAIALSRLTRVVAYESTGDRASLQQLIQTMDAATLLSESWIKYSVVAFRQLGMADELEMATTAASRIARSQIADSWAKLDADAAVRGAELARMLGDKALIPKEWIDAICTPQFSDLAQRQVRLSAALLRQDWQATEEIAAGLNRDHPNRYEPFWARARALHALGRDREAIAPLRIYTEVARDEPEYLEAVELLKELTP